MSKKPIPGKRAALRRALPVAGVILFCLPLLWTGGAAGRTSTVLLYIFVVWAGLITATLLTHVLRRRKGHDQAARMDPSP